MDYPFCIALSVVPFLLLSVVPSCAALILCLIECCTHICKSGDSGSGTRTFAGKQVPDCGSCLEETLINRLVKAFGIKTDSSGDNMLYGYKLSAPVMYYLFFFTVYVFSATCGIFWTRFVLKESHQCNPQNANQDCFNITDNNHSYIDCNKVNVTGSQVVCFEFVFDFHDAFSSAAGLLSACFYASTAITLVGVMISGGESNHSCKCFRRFVATTVVILILSGATVAYGLIIYLLHFGDRSSRDVTETMNVTILYSTVLLACFVRWCYFQDMTFSRDENGDENLPIN